MRAWLFLLHPDRCMSGKEVELKNKAQMEEEKLSREKSMAAVKPALQTVELKQVRAPARCGSAQTQRSFSQSITAGTSFTLNVTLSASVNDPVSTLDILEKAMAGLRDAIQNVRTEIAPASKLPLAHLCWCWLCC